MSKHRYPVGLTLGYLEKPESEVLPVTINSQIESEGESVMYAVENQLNEDLFVVAESTLHPRTADYLQLYRIYQLVAMGLESRSVQAEQAEDLTEAARLLRAASVCYETSQSLMKEANRRMDGSI